MRRAVRALALAAAVWAGCWAAPVHAQSGAPAQRRPDVAGAFDYYLLALSWSPSFCALPGMAAREPRQCGADRRYSFIVHGLWPQYERGWPARCATTQPRDVAPALVAKQLDLMPSPKLVENQWDRHGVCSGLSPEAYFNETRRLRAKIVIPAAFVNPAAPVTLTPAAVRAAFVKANPGLPPTGLVLSCERTRLREVRVCFTRAGAVRACGASVRDRCEAPKVTLPPVRPAGPA